MGWHATLALAYRREGPRSIVHDRHDGPLRVLKSLHDEPGICQSVLVHPPGGIVGGDRLEIAVDVGAAAHALVTTPGATRFYRSLGETASQAATLRVARGARLEWLPLETLAYDGCLADNTVQVEAEPGAEAIGWDVLALGLPASGQPFARGRFRQHLQIGDRWLDRGVVDGDDTRLLESPLGWAGQRTLATVWFAAGDELAAERRERLVESAREALAGCGDGTVGARAGVSAVDASVVVARILAPRVEPAMQACVAVWSAWRALAWGLAARPPRVWRT